MLPEDARHALGVMSSANDMRLENFICDFKIKVASETFDTHRLILATNSEYFKSLFSSNMREATESYVIFTTLSASVVKQCVDYMYTSSCNIRSESVSELLKAANFLQISRLENRCFEFLRNNLTPENAMAILRLAKVYGQRDIKDAAERLIENNLEIVITSELFPTINQHELARYVANADCKIAWTAMLTWSQGKGDGLEWLMEQTDLSKYPFKFLLEDVLPHPLVNKYKTTSALVIANLFSDEVDLINHLNVQNCFHLYNLADRYLQLGLRDDGNKLAIDVPIMIIIRTFMAENFVALISDQDFRSLSVEELKLLLIYSTPESEESKWQAVLTWVKGDVSSRKRYFAELLSFLQFGQLEVEFLRNIRQEQLVQSDNECMQILVDALLTKTLERASISSPDANNEIPTTTWDSSGCKVSGAEFEVTHPDHGADTDPTDSPYVLENHVVQSSAVIDSPQTLEITPQHHPGTILGDKAPNWDAGQAATQCNACAHKFSFIKRKVYCKACGGAFCANCCNNKCQLKYLDKKGAKVCLACSEIIKTGSKRVGWEIKKNTLSSLQLSFSGTYSDIYKGLWNKVAEVTIETLKHGTMSREDFLRESEILKLLRHENIVSLYGEVLEDPISIVTEYMSHGTLLGYLIREKALSFRQRLNMASQVAGGLAYMESRNCVHRCVMADSVLVDGRHVCKLSHFHMARFVGNEGCKKVQGEKFPIKWTAPEIFSNGNFTTKSDVWSFGIVLTEIVNKGRIPYEGMTNSEVVERVKSVFRMERPPDCPEPLYDVMLQCWRTEAIRRPTFEFIQGYLEDYFNATEDYFEVSERGMKLT